VADADAGDAPWDFLQRLEAALSTELRLPSTGPGWLERRRSYELLEFWWKLMRAIWSQLGTQTVVLTPHQVRQVLGFKPATFAANFRAVWRGPWADFIRAAQTPRSLKLGRDYGFVEDREHPGHRLPQPLAADNSEETRTTSEGSAREPASGGSRSLIHWTLDNKL
jgi:hypothetical protein